MKFPPAAVYASRIANEVAASAVQPNTLPPRQSGDTSRSVPPMRLITGSVKPAHRAHLVDLIYSEPHRRELSSRLNDGRLVTRARPPAVLAAASTIRRPAWSP